MTALLIGLADPLAVCPRCGKLGRRLGSRPIDGEPIYHCGKCGCIWPDPPARAVDMADRGRR